MDMEVKIDILSLHGSHITYGTYSLFSRSIFNSTHFSVNI